MSTRKNAFGSGSESFDPDIFKNTDRKEIDIEAAAKAGVKAGFNRDFIPPNITTTEAKDRVTVIKRPGRPRTGRNYQLNLKVRPETAEDLESIADANYWGFGETLEHMIECWRKNGGQG